MALPQETTRYRGTDTYSLSQPGLVADLRGDGRKFIVTSKYQVVNDANGEVYLTYCFRQLMPLI